MRRRKEQKVLFSTQLEECECVCVRGCVMLRISDKVESSLLNPEF